MYEDGCDGLPQNIELSIKYIQLAADNGLLAAINKLGELYLFGEVVPVNYKKAVSYFWAASKGGYGRASYWLGRLHTDGVGGLEKILRRQYHIMNKQLSKDMRMPRNGSNNSVKILWMKM